MLNYRPFVIIVRLSGSLDNFDDGEPIQTFKPAGNKNTSKESALKHVKNIVKLCGCKIEEIIDIRENK